MIRKSVMAPLMRALVSIFLVLSAGSIAQGMELSGTNGAVVHTAAAKGTLPVHILRPPERLATSETSHYELRSSALIVQQYRSVSLQSTLISQQASARRLKLFDLKRTKKKALIDLYTTYGYNRAVKDEIRLFATYRRPLTERLTRGAKFIDLMSGILIEKGLPEELVFLPLIESGFRTDARSPKGAVGPWQLMPMTARNQGLKIDYWMDERRDPVKSTIAAAHYLHKLYDRFQSWSLVLAAYNAGEGKISRTIRRLGSDNYWTMRKTRLLSGETRKYVPAFVAAAAIAIHPERFGFSKIKYTSPLAYETVIIETPMDLSMVARFAGVDVATIQELNPELLRWCTPPNVPRYELRIPPDASERFLARLEDAGGEDLMQVKLYEVRHGDTVEKIARKVGTSVKSIVDMNSLGRKAVIRAGHQILVPVSTSEEDSATSSQRGQDSLQRAAESKEL